MQAPNILCNIPILFAVSRIISRGSQFPAISSDLRINFAVLPKQIFLELAPPVFVPLRIEDIYLIQPYLTLQLSMVTTKRLKNAVTEM